MALVSREQKDQARAGLVHVSLKRRLISQVRAGLCAGAFLSQAKNLPLTAIWAVEVGPNEDVLDTAYLSNHPTADYPRSVKERAEVDPC